MLIYKDKGYYLFYGLTGTSRYLISKFSNERECVEKAVEDYKALLREGFIPLLKRNREPIPLPCGYAKVGLVYTTWVQSTSGILYSKFSITYPDITRGACRTRSMHIERGEYTASPKYFAKLKKAKQFLDEKREEFRQHLLDNLTVDYVLNNN